MSSKHLFRVYFEDGHKLHLHADNSEEARKLAKRKYDGFITKIKHVEEKENA